MITYSFINYYQLLLSIIKPSSFLSLSLKDVHETGGAGQVSSPQEEGRRENSWKIGQKLGENHGETMGK